MLNSPYSLFYNSQGTLFNFRNTKVCSLILSLNSISYLFIQELVLASSCVLSLCIQKIKRITYKDNQIQLFVCILYQNFLDKFNFCIAILNIAVISNFSTYGKIKIDEIAFLQPRATPNFEKRSLLLKMCFINKIQYF